MFWYEYEVKQLEQLWATFKTPPETLFYGSSSIRLWETLPVDLGALKPAKLGFGGSTLAACVWFFDRIMQGYQPKRLVVYAGDNDLGDGRHPEEVFIFFQQLVARAKWQFGSAIPCYYISLKPSPARQYLIDQYKYTNGLIEKEIAKTPNWKFIDVFSQMVDDKGKPKKEYFLPDDLHLNPKGYQLWTETLKEAITN